MRELLERCVEHPGDIVAQCWVAAAVREAISDPESEFEFTRLREAVLPFTLEFERRAARVRGAQLPMLGRSESEPLLALAVTVAKAGFGRWGGEEGRRRLFCAILEVALSVDRAVVGHVTGEVATALRLEIEALTRNPTARPMMPSFATAWELMEWFPAQTDRFRIYVVEAWRRKFGPALRLALLTPVRRQGAGGLLDDDDEEWVPIPTCEIEGVPPAQLPLDGWLIPEQNGTPDGNQDEGAEEDLQTWSLSTVTPLSRFAKHSTSILDDQEMELELRACLQDADLAWEAKDSLGTCKALARAIIGATATAPTWISQLRWASEEDGDPSYYPGVISLDAAWLLRAELRRSKQGSDKRKVVPIPLPPNLRSRLLRFGAPKPGEPVLSSLLEEKQPLSETAGPGRATLSQLFRTPISRLMRTHPYGISLAQHVAGNDLGLDDAVLSYDRIAANQVAKIVSETTFRWFGDNPRDHLLCCHIHEIGSRRVVEVSEVSVFLEELRQAHAAAESGEPWMRLRQRMRYDVHGLALMSGHRPNDGFSRITASRISMTDPIATVSDKEVSCDWLLRPIALSKRWQMAFQALLFELERSAAQYPETPLAEAALRAIDGSGPVFLDVRSPHDVRLFGREAYQEGLPAGLKMIDNFARQILNHQLTWAVPECLRVAQLGWHGTREGAWADGSPWSVLTAATELQPALDVFLKKVGWRPLSIGSRPPRTLHEWPLAWADREQEHKQCFHRDLREAKQSMVQRHASLAEKLRPRLSAFLEGSRLGVILTPDGKLARVDAEGEAPLPLSLGASESMIEALAGRDSRSLESRVGRNLVVALLRQARKAGIVTGPLPRGFAWRWPSRPGPFLAAGPAALTQARQLDKLIARKEVPESLKAAVSLLLHGPIADVESVLAALRPGARLSTLPSEPGILLLEPAPDPSSLVATLSGETRHARGCLAYHGLAALHPMAWHRNRPESGPTEAELDAGLWAIAPDIWCERIRQGGGAGSLREVAALARACNSFRQDGIARLVGTGQVRLTTVSLDRVVAARERHRIPSRQSPPDFPGTSRNASASALGQGPPDDTLLDDLFAKLVEAAHAVDENTRVDAPLREALIEHIRGLLSPLISPSPSALVARFVLALLERGGTRTRHLAMATIRDRAYSVGRFIRAAFPADPLRMESSLWEEAYLCIVAETSKETRVQRAQDLMYFHRVLGREIPVPEVDFSPVCALAGSETEAADAGFLTDHELDALFSMLARDAAVGDTCGASNDDVFLARARELAAHLSLGAAMRPGEVARLRFSDAADPLRVRVRRTHYQRLKTINSRRRAALHDGTHATTASRLLSQWRTSCQARLAGDYSQTMPMFHLRGDARQRILDADIYSRIGRLIRWATGDPSGRTYWLRNTGVRRRLEEHMGRVVRSLWPIRDLLSEIAHGGLLTTLRDYTHDPVTAFLKWFSTEPAEISGSRLAIAVGRSRSRVSRQRERHRLCRTGVGARSRIATLLGQAPVLDSGCGDLVELPGMHASSGHNDYPLEELSRILRHIAKGETAFDALRCHDWSANLQQGLISALARLEQEHAIVLGKARAASSERLYLQPPRALSKHAGVANLSSAKHAPDVLAEMGEQWLAVVRLGLVQGIPASQEQWSRWVKSLPLLADIGWEERTLGRSLQVRAPVRDGSKLDRWPMLRWLVVVAWIRRQLLAASCTAAP